ncbi:unnamed protein product, partial [Linum tenue]
VNSLVDQKIINSVPVTSRTDRIRILAIICSFDVQTTNRFRLQDRKDEENFIKEYWDFYSSCAELNYVINKIRSRGTELGRWSCATATPS